jgi:cytochrome c-type biogenesis protein CcmH
MRRLLVTLSATAVLASLFAAPIAVASCPRATLADIEDEVMCPVCGVPLELAEAPQAERERAFVQSLIDRCRSKREIKTALVSEFGPSVLALPEDDGFNLAAYLVPALAILAASAGIALAMARWQRERRRDASQNAALDGVRALDPADLARLNAELDRRER